MIAKSRELYNAVKNKRSVTFVQDGRKVSVFNLGLLPYSFGGDDLQFGNTTAEPLEWTYSEHQKPVFVDHGAERFLVDAQNLDLSQYEIELNGLWCRISSADILQSYCVIKAAHDTPRPNSSRSKTQFGYRLQMHADRSINVSDNALLVFFVCCRMASSMSMDVFFETYAIQGSLHRLESLYNATALSDAPNPYCRGGQITLEGKELFRVRFEPYLREEGMVPTAHFGEKREVMRTSEKMPTSVQNAIRRRGHTLALGNGVKGMVKENVLHMCAPNKEHTLDVPFKPTEIGLVFLKAHVHLFIQMYGNRLIVRNRQTIGVRVLFTFADGSYLAEYVTNPSTSGVVRIYPRPATEVGACDNPNAFADNLPGNEEGGLLTNYMEDLTMTDPEAEYLASLTALFDDLPTTFDECVRAEVERVAKRKAKALFEERYDIYELARHPEQCAKAPEYIEACVREAKETDPLCVAYERTQGARRDVERAKRSLEEARNDLYSEYRKRVAC